MIKILVITNLFFNRYNMAKKWENERHRAFVLLPSVHGIVRWDAEIK